MLDNGSVIDDGVCPGLIVDSYQSRGVTTMRLSLLEAKGHPEKVGTMVFAVVACWRKGIASVVVGLLFISISNGRE